MDSANKQAPPVTRAVMVIDPSSRTSAILPRVGKAPCVPSIEKMASFSRVQEGTIGSLSCRRERRLRCGCIGRSVDGRCDG